MASAPIDMPEFSFQPVNPVTDSSPDASRRVPLVSGREAAVLDQSIPDAVIR